MNSAKSILLANCLALFSSPLFCANISVLVIETGLRDGKPVRQGEVTRIWESGLMDVFFEEGHIVTNAQAFALAKKPGKELTGEIQGYIMEAEETGIDYFVLAYLNYEAAADGGRTSELPKPTDIEFNLFNINPSKRVWTQDIDLRRIGYPHGDEQTRVKRAARSLIVHLGDNI
jgi:hypothetical protein